MIKKTITFEDYNGEKRTEDFYFNLTKAEIAELELTTEGGLEVMIDKMIKTKNNPDLVRLFKRLILMSYGEKSPDGRRFIKNDRLTEEFTQTAAYSELFMELATNSDSALKFINGVLPRELQEAISAQELNKVMPGPGSR